MDTTRWRADLNEPLRDRLVVVGVLPLRFGAGGAAPQALADELREAGARDVLFLGSVAGEAQHQPAEGSPRCVRVHLPRPESLCDSIRTEQRVLDDPPAEVRRAVADFDPHGEAVWLGHQFLTRPEVLGRPVIGHRPPRWAALEDKTVADALFDATRVPRAASRVVPRRPRELAVASRWLDAGDGTVWSGDSAAEMNGGAELVRRVRGRDQARSAAAVLAGCQWVRVAPFMEGVPCSIHGIVLPDGVVVGRPVELVMLRRAGTGEFVYAGLSTWWDPPGSDREEMRDVVRRLGAHLAAAVGYRGAFGVDGVLTAEGFRPTELNTRATVALDLVADAGDVPVAALQRSLLDGRDPGIDAPALERGLLGPADAARAGWVRGFVLSPDPMTPEQVTVTGGPAGMRVAADDDEPVGVLERGPAPVGGMVRWQPADGVLAVGDLLCAWAPAVLALADARLGSRFGDLEAPVPVR